MFNCWQILQPQFVYIAISFGSYTPKEMHQIVSNPKVHLKLIFVHAYERMQNSEQLNLDLFVDMHIKKQKTLTHRFKWDKIQFHIKLFSMISNSGILILECQIFELKYTRNNCTAK